MNNNHGDIIHQTPLINTVLALSPPLAFPNKIRNDTGYECGVPLIEPRLFTHTIFLFQKEIFCDLWCKEI